ncbi:hypothetical protein P3X46_000506 [Hevea brasiliensis]|uniref:PRA1 family protein n=1 Tax=Hevea brasiliensis TaxID=3981 RepID=A0ABQ9NB65_HEVBR|nr:hypothetical protein P3X46_000506 [Hevea brasiliensis]
MASYGAIQRPSAATRSVSTVDSGDLRDSTTGTNWNDFKHAELKLVCPFKISSSPEAAAQRIIRNLSHFTLYYTHCVWIIVFISLIPK